MAWQVQGWAQTVHNTGLWDLLRLGLGHLSDTCLVPLIESMNSKILIPMKISPIK